MRLFCAAAIGGCVLLGPGSLLGEGSVLGGGLAQACGGYGGPGSVGVPWIGAEEPAPPSVSASELLGRARRLEGEAQRHERRARIAEAEAARDSRAAYRLRDLAAELWDARRNQLLASAAELERAAASAGHLARRLKDRARALRLEADLLRQRASVLGGGGGWRGSPPSRGGARHPWAS